ENVRDRKLDVIVSMQPLVGEDGAADQLHVMRAQYAAGWVNGAGVPGYRGEDGVAATSTTETYVALRMLLDSWRWAGIPFYIRTGKRLPKRTTALAVQLRRPRLQRFE